MVLLTLSSNLDPNEPETARIWVGLGFRRRKFVNLDVVPMIPKLEQRSEKDERLRQWKTARVRGRERNVKPLLKVMAVVVVDVPAIDDGGGEVFGYSFLLRFSIGFWVLRLFPPSCSAGGGSGRWLVYHK